MEARDFDEWREKYDSMTFEEHAAFYRRLHADHPDQSFFDAEGVKRLIGLIGSDNMQVTELGGYDGGLAKACLEAFPGIVSWDNYDIASPGPVTSDSRYEAHALSEKFTDADKPDDPDLFVASHVIEHLSNQDAYDVLCHMQGTPYLFLDAPLDERGRDGWNGTTAAHILEWSWPRLEDVLMRLHYRRMPLQSSGRAYVYST